MESELKEIRKMLQSLENEFDEYDPKASLFDSLAIAYFTYEDEDGCASFHKECPYLTTESDAEEILKRLKDKDCNYEIHESRATVEENLNLMDGEAQTYISQLEIVEVEWKVKDD